MPELPEVETIRRQLESLIVGKTISSIEVLNPGSFRAQMNSFIGKTIVSVGRKDKVLILLSDEQTLFIHLKMSGRLEFKAKGRRTRDEGDKHLRVYFKFADGSRLLFHDQRKFGWISNDPAALPAGIDALDPALSSRKLSQILASSSRPIKQILLDQSKIAGIGNIYVSEILWEAKLSPLAKAKSEIRNHKSYRLLSAIRRVLLDAIKFGGSTMADGLYQQVGGEAGDYWPRRRVYDRAGELCRRPACRRKNSLIRKITIGQRSTYFCPNCQK